VQWRLLACVLALIVELCCLAQAAIAVESSLDSIKQRGVVTVCADPDNLPFSSSALNPPGFDIEIAQAIAKQLNVGLNYFWYATNHGQRALRQLTEGNCDFFMGLPADPNSAESNPRILLSAPYYSGGFAPLVRTDANLKTVADLKPQDVGVQMVTVPDVVLFNEGYSRRLFKTPQDVFSAIAKGTIDAGVVTAPVGGWLAKQNPTAKIHVARLTRPDFLFPIAVGVKKGNEDLKAEIDKALALMRVDGRIDQILERYGVPQLTAEGTQQEETAQQASAKVAAKPSGAAAAADLHDGTSAPTSAQDIAAGRRLYRQACYKCHGPEGVSGGTIKDVRQYIGTDPEFLQLVRNGRSGTAMPPWKEILTDKEIMQIRAYIKQLPTD
jgi:ABC-type amino acid transport substrate-binding protein/cytochrome c553